MNFHYLKQKLWEYSLEMWHFEGGKNSIMGVAKTVLFLRDEAGNFIGEDFILFIFN